MSRMYTQIPTDVGQTLQMNAGIIAKTFDPASGTVGDIIGATTGGLSISATPTYSDFGEDIDNCPKNMKELKRIDAWECKCSGTFLTITAAKCKEYVGAAKIDTNNNTHIQLKSELTDSDFSDLWFIGDYGVNGFLAVKLSNTLNTKGFSLKTTDKKKGQFEFEYTAHYSKTAPETVPFDIYIKDGDGNAITYDLTDCERMLGDNAAADGADVVARFVAANGKSLPAEVTVTEDGDTLTSGADYVWTQSTGVLVVNSISGDINITVTAS